MNKLEEKVQAAIINNLDQNLYSVAKITIFWSINLKNKLSAEFVSWCEGWGGKVSLSITSDVQDVAIEIRRVRSDFYTINEENENE